MSNTPEVFDGFEYTLSQMSPQDRLKAENAIAETLTKNRSIGTSRSKKDLSWAMEPGMRTGGYSEEGKEKILEYLNQSPDYSVKTNAESTQISLKAFENALTQQINQYEAMRAKPENLFTALNEQGITAQPALIDISSLDNTATST